MAGHLGFSYILYGQSISQKDMILLEKIKYYYCLSGLDRCWYAHVQLYFQILIFMIHGRQISG